MNSTKIKIGFIIACLFSLWSTSTFAFDFEKNPNDISYYYLGQIFGPVGNLFNTTANDLLGQIFKVFNMALLALGSLVVMYTVIISTIQTAQEGEAMGRKFGSLWVPIRAVAGLAVLLPTTTGYSLIQILMAWIILQGVWAANGIYNIILDNALSGGSLNQPSPNTVEDTSLTLAANNLFKSAVCMAYLNNPSNQGLVENQSVTVYQGTNSNVLYAGVEGSNSYGQICGTFTASPPMQSVVDNDAVWTSQQLQAVQDALNTLSGPAQEAATMPSNQTPSGQNVIDQAKDTLRQTILATPAKPYSATTQHEQQLQQILRQAKVDGWLYAGSYYFQLIKPPGFERSITLTVPMTSVPQANPSIDSDPWTVINNKVSAYLSATSRNSSSSSDSQLNIGSQASDSIFAQLANLLKPIGYSVINDIKNADPDPLVGFASVGSTIIAATEGAWFAILLAAIAIIAGACWGDAMLPACTIATGTLAICMPIFIGLIVFLWSSGIIMTLYLPLVPYLVFTFTALGWLMLVIETLVAAPIVALGITTPAQDALGRAAPAAMLITNVFLRPSLMLVGFVAAAQLLIASFKMINFSFIGSLEAAMGNIGIFGSIVIVVLYVGVMTTVINQVFSLIYILPDKVIRWIGGHAEASAVERAMGEAHRGVESGAKTSGEVVKYGASAVESLAKSSEKKVKAKAKYKAGLAGGSGGGGPAPGGGGGGGGPAPGGGGGGGLAPGGGGGGPAPGGGGAGGPPAGGGLAPGAGGGGAGPLTPPGRPPAGGGSPPPGPGGGGGAPPPAPGSGGGAGGAASGGLDI